ncbi:hypothetical protein ADL22_22820 [Streptomyces sp. NRRL F-4489]|uniref:hypothetical protein n=1 Tax=Streptomyces sp. NRRL F-4489 TaxID=1609095 RepID=UPI000749B91A|nr:hypothetical protein [Streptomyces sp. NRRL F-4489]KUL37114.1 hypothetical protein ADL22_22820 [Streptomyces sp. NRRL F-4489]
MYASELEIRVRYEELRREADRRRLVREATEGAREAARNAARSGSDEPEGRVREGRIWRGRTRRAAV